MKVYIVFDGPPGPESGRFVEVENEKGEGVKIEKWEEMTNQVLEVRDKEKDLHFWRLGPFETVVEDHSMICNCHEVCNHGG